MDHALLVTVRFHEGRYHGTGDWPPAPARLFQALVAGSARGGSIPDAALRALDWLERLPPPTVAAPRGVPGQPCIAYVPNNDLDAELSKGAVRNLDKAVAAIRVAKNIRPILFDAEIPVLYCWPLGDDAGQAAALCATVEELYRLGRGIDMAWAEAQVVEAAEAEERIAGLDGIVYRPVEGGAFGRDLLCPLPGSRQSLTDRFEATRKRFRVGGTNRKPTRVFVQPPKPLLAKVAYNAPPRRLAFELRKADSRAGFAVWPLKGAAGLVQEVRDKAAERLCAAAPELTDRVERYLVGRGADDGDKAARVRVVPIPSIGHPNTNGAIRRIAVHVPQACPLKIDDLEWAFTRVAWTDDDGVVCKELQKAADVRMMDRFEHRGRRWRSVTPAALSAARRRRTDPAGLPDGAKGGCERAGEEARAAAVLRQALRHAGIRAPVAGMRVQRDPFDRSGERADSFAAGTRFPKEALWHVMLEFAEPAAGPLLLGDGRYLGLGLLRPDDPPPGVLAFAIQAGLADGAEPAAVAYAARRAMMARVQASLPRGEKIPTYVSGHQESGAPAGDGVHRHIAVVADLPRRRLLYVAPHLLQRRGVRWREIEKEHRQATGALEGMDVLRAGKAGKLVLAPSPVDREDDPLFAPSRVWESVTDYDVTRHCRRLGAHEALRADAAAELVRCGRPRLPPDAVEVLAVRRGPRGGLSGRLRFTFPTAQEGPLLIGRSAHKGGGVFAGR